MDGKKIGWHNYFADASDVVEGVFMEWRKFPTVDVKSIKSGTYHYDVNFNKMS